VQVTPATTTFFPDAQGSKRNLTPDNFKSVSFQNAFTSGATFNHPIAPSKSVDKARTFYSPSFSPYVNLQAYAHALETPVSYTQVVDSSATKTYTVESPVTYTQVVQYPSYTNGVSSGISHGGVVLSSPEPSVVKRIQMPDSNKGVVLDHAHAAEKESLMP